MSYIPTEVVNGHKNIYLAMLAASQWRGGSKQTNRMNYSASSIHVRDILLPTIIYNQSVTSYLILLTIIETIFTKNVSALWKVLVLCLLWAMANKKT